MGLIDFNGSQVGDGDMYHHLCTSGDGMIDFNVPPFLGPEFEYVRVAASNHKLCGDGPFTLRCNKWIEHRFDIQKALLTTSGTSALEMAAILCNLEPGDEVILPSFTFPSTATAFQMVGARLVFVDIRPDTMNIDERKIERAITPRTRVIVVVHYAGVSCAMDEIMQIARDHGLLVVEDAAQGVMSTYNCRALGSLGDFGCYSFHETKNYSMGEGGALTINNPRYNDRAEIIREKGTNRQRFFRGLVDKYTWVDRGGSYLPSDLSAAYLWGQLENADAINEDRLGTWKHYDESLRDLSDANRIELPCVPPECVHNAHMYYIKCANLGERTEFISFMKSHGVGCVFHYIPLHSSPAGLRFGRFDGVDEYTTSQSERLVRLPMYYGLSHEDGERIVELIHRFFG